MAYTSHGHRIPGTISEGKPRSVARCGGVRFCKECRQEAERILALETEGVTPAQEAEDEYRSSVISSDIIYSEAQRALLRTGLSDNETFNALNALKVAGLALTKEV